nr:site-specific integrase [uncultured Rhodopila sp.]
MHVDVKHDGADPIADKRRDLAMGKAARAGIGTLAAVLDLYGAKRGDAQKAWGEARKRIDLIFKDLLARPAETLTRPALQMLADGYASQSSASYAVRSLRPALKWAAQRGYVTEDATRIVPPAPVKRRKRVLARGELAALVPVLRSGAAAYDVVSRFSALAAGTDVAGLHWRQIDLAAGTLTRRTRTDGAVTVHKLKMSPAAITLLRGLPPGLPGDLVFPHATAHPAAMLLMLLTLTRRQEAATARWRDVDLDAKTWTIPDTKNGEPHTVPLSRQALDLIRSRLPIDDAGNAKQPDPDGLVFATSTGAAPGNWDRETKALQEASGTKDWTRHDLRRTGATLLGEMGELPDIIEAALNHVSIHSALAATYNQSRYRPQVAAALQRLADALDGIEAGAGQVVPLRAAAG